MILLLIIIIMIMIVMIIITGGETARAAAAVAATAVMPRRPPAARAFVVTVAVATVCWSYEYVQLVEQSRTSHTRTAHCHRNTKHLSLINIMSKHARI